MQNGAEQQPRVRGLQQDSRQIAHGASSARACCSAGAPAAAALGACPVGGAAAVPPPPAAAECPGAGSPGAEGA